MCDLKIQTAHTKLLILNNLALDSQVQGSTVDLYLKLNTLLVTYDHDSIFNWLRTNFMRNRGVTMRGGVKRRNRRWLEKLAEKYVLNGCAEFCHVSTVIKVAQSSSSMGFGLVKVILEQAREKRGKFVFYFVIFCHIIIFLVFLYTESLTVNVFAKSN